MRTMFFQKEIEEYNFWQGIIKKYLKEKSLKYSQIKIYCHAKNFCESYEQKNRRRIQAQFIF
jgi:hypothetical protein